MTYPPDSLTQRAVRWYPPAYDIRVESVPTPSILDADDAIIRIKLAGLCGSDLHIYRGHEDVDSDLICGHEFIGEVVALGSNFGIQSSGRPELYSSLKIGDKVVSPFTVSCGECHFCRLGFTCRCIHSCLFGIPTLPGGQAQYIRVPKAGGTLFSLTSLSTELRTLGDKVKSASVENVADSSLLLLADILPTGVFVALQALQHPKTAPLLTARPYPFSSVVPNTVVNYGQSLKPVSDEDRLFTIAVVGLGPVGVCATVSLLDMLDNTGVDGLQYRVVAIDPVQSRREKMEAVYSAMGVGKGRGTFVVASIENGKEVVQKWTNERGCNAVLEVVGNNSALTLAYELVRPFGVISSVGVHQEPPIPFTGREVYNKNVSFDFGRCPVRAMLPLALEVLLKYQNVFGGVGEHASLVEKIVGFDEAQESYEMFDKGKCGKILFDPWK